MICHLLNLSFIGLTFSIYLGVTLLVASRNGAQKSPPSLTESLASESVVILSNTCVLGWPKGHRAGNIREFFLVAAAKSEDVGS